MDELDKILEYEGLVGSIIQRYTKYFDSDDLYQVGMLGLINAYRNFDDSKNTKFSTYAYYYVLGEVKRYVRESSLVKISPNIIKLNNSINKVSDMLKQKLGRNLTDEEIAAFMDIDYSKIEEVREAMLDVKSLDYSYDSCDNDLYNSVAITDENTRPDVLDLKMEIERLPKDEKKLIIARYYEDMTQSETSKKLGMSQVQVSRKEGKILQKLRGALKT